MKRPRFVRGRGLAWDVMSMENVRILAQQGCEKNLGLLGGQCLHASIQTALVARRSVVMQNALLHALVQQGDGLVVLRPRRGNIALLQCLAHGAQAVSELAAVGAVDGGALDGLPGAL